MERAWNLKKTAEASPKALPKTQEELIKLPGIGKYTASAICSFGHNQTIPVVDTNIARVIKRYFALLNPSDAILWRYAAEFVNENDPRHHNLALMDLGSLVCLPKNTKCLECSLQDSCQGKNEPELYTQTKKTQYEDLELFYGVYIKNNQIALKVSQEKMYKDMLILPSVEPIEEQFLGNFKHSYTKYKLTVNLYKIEDLEDEFTWIDLNDLENAPISSLTKKAQKFFCTSYQTKETL